MKKFLLLSLSVLILSCNSNENQNTKDFAEKKAEPNIDSGFVVTKTTELMTANATKEYTHKTRSKTQFALDKNSREEIEKDFLIKISESKVIITDPENNLIHEYSIKKKWLDKAGPETIYNLIDSNNIECSLGHYVDYQKYDFFAFRYKKVLETYSNDKE